VGLMEFVITRSKHSASAADLVKVRVEEVFISNLTHNSTVFQHEGHVLGGLMVRTSAADVIIDLSAIGAGGRMDSIRHSICRNRHKLAITVIRRINLVLTQ
jgi:hypothetical protein